MALMKIISVAILVIGVNVIGAPGPQGTASPLIEKCSQDSGLKADAMMNDTREITSEFLCFFKCVGEGSGVITGTGELDITKADALPMQLPRALKEQFNGCLSKITKVEKCEDVKEAAECVAVLHSKM